MKLIRKICFLLLIPIFAQADVSHLICLETNPSNPDEAGFYPATLTVNKQALADNPEYPGLSAEEAFTSVRVSKHFAKDLICRLTDTGNASPNSKLPRLAPLIEGEPVETGNLYAKLTARDVSWSNLNEKVKQLKSTNPDLLISLNEAEFNFSNATRSTFDNGSGFNAYGQYFEDASNSASAGSHTKTTKLLVMLASLGTILSVVDYHDAAVLTSLAVVGVVDGGLALLPYLGAQATFTAMLNLQALNTLSSRVLSEHVTKIEYIDRERSFHLPDAISDIKAYEVEYIPGLNTLASHLQALGQTYNQVVEEFKTNFLSNHLNLVQTKQWEQLREKFTEQYNPKKDMWNSKVPKKEQEQLKVFDLVLAAPVITMKVIIYKVMKAPAASIAIANLVQAGANGLLDYYFHQPWEHAVVPYCVYNERRGWDSSGNLCSTGKSVVMRHGMPIMISLLAIKTVFFSKPKLD